MRRTASGAVYPSAKAGDPCEAGVEQVPDLAGAFGAQPARLIVRPPIDTSIARREKSHGVNLVVPMAMQTIKVRSIQLSPDDQTEDGLLGGSHDRPPDFLIAHRNGPFPICCDAPRADRGFLFA